MAKIGLKYPIYAPATETSSAISYAGGSVLGKAISANIAITTNDVKLYADDSVVESDHSFSSGTITINVDELGNAAQVALLGYTEGAEVDATLGTKELSVSGSATPAYVGFGFYGKKIVAGASRWRAIWLKKVQFAEPADDAATKGETTEFQTPTLEGTILVDVTGEWKNEGTFSTEAGAIAWLNAKAALPVDASTGLSALALTGTAGTLSPSFGADVRYYTFGGVTSASVTVTPTAAAHTIKLYVDGVFVQNVASGSASAAIAMAIGTKKLTIVAQESGKLPQTTEIVVVKVS